MREIDELSFREKSALVSLLAVLFVYGGYFADLLLGAPERTLSAMLYASIGVVIAVVVIEIVFHAALGMYDADDANAPADERDRLVTSRAARVSHLVLSTGVIIVLCRIIIRGAMDEAAGVDELSLFEIANLLLFFFVASEVSGYGAQVYFYRRGVERA